MSLDQIAQKKCGGVAVYVKSKWNCTCLYSVSKPNFFELLAIKLHFSNGHDIIVIGCKLSLNLLIFFITGLIPN